MTIDFSGQTVLITGGTRGIGLQIAKDMHTAGANIILTGTNPDSFKPIYSFFPEGKGSVEYISVDFLNVESTLNFLSELERILQIDVLINNSGINRINEIDKTKVEDWDDLISVNLKAPFLLIRNISRKMKNYQYGRIVNIGSIFGVISKPKRALYSVTKHGLHGLTVACALDLAPHGILVNTISPGFVLTELTKSILSPIEIEELTEQIPIGRFAQPEDISAVVLFLSSAENRYITGQNIIVDGGFISV